MSLMNFYKLFATLMLLSTSIFAAADLETLLRLQPGMKIDSKLKLEETLKDYVYEISVEKNHIQSIEIHFTPPMDSNNFFAPNANGFCLVQKREGDVDRSRYFFFDIKNHKRYEINQEKKVRSIIIQEMPEAIKNPRCTFDKFSPRDEKK